MSISSQVMASPIPVSEIESVLAWVDSHKLTRPTKKIHRDFSDGVLLAEILQHHYPKLVEMHNYPPRNSHALKLNNWNTINRKVLKKLRLNISSATMEQLAGSTPGVIERVLIMVRDKVKRDEEMLSSTKGAEQNMSSGGSYYEPCEEDENVLVIPVKMRINGVMEIVQQKVVSYDSYMTLKEELKDAKDTINMLKQKVEHLDTMLGVKDVRINELYKQLERKQSRRNIPEQMNQVIPAPLDESPPSPKVQELQPNNAVRKTQSLKQVDKNEKLKPEDSKKEISSCKITPKASITNLFLVESDSEKSVDIVRSDVFEEASEEVKPRRQDSQVFREMDSTEMITLKDAVQNEIADIVRPYPKCVNCV